MIMEEAIETTTDAHSDPHNWNSLLDRIALQQ